MERLKDEKIKFEYEMEKNVMLETYLIHARNLMDFFNRISTPHEDDIVAEDYFDDWQERRKGYVVSAHLDKFIRWRINKQLSHMTYTRVDIPEEYKGFAGWPIKDELIRLLKKFVQEVPAELMYEKLPPLLE